MKLDHIPLDKLYVDKTNMRFGRKAPDVSDLLPTIRARGVIQTLLVRPPDAQGRYGIVAGRRRFHASCIVADERREAGDVDPDALLLPCAIMEDGDDAAAIEASMIENMARLDADEVRQWESFTRLVREGRGLDEIALTFGLPELSIRRVLALGNLLPRIRDLYRAERIDRVTVRHLTLASKSQQRAWLALFDDAHAHVPIGHQIKAWLFGGQSIPVRFALFDIAGFGGATIADLFGEDRYFADPEAFWTAQNAAIAAARDAYLAAGWTDVVVIPPAEHFHAWEHEKAAKRKGGRVYIDVRATGEVTFHEGYVTRAEACRIARGDTTPPPKPHRPELTSSLQTYVDLHRHAAVRAALIGHPGLALRLLVAHAIVGSPLWTVRPEPQATRNQDVRDSVARCRAEAVFQAEWRVVLDLLGFAAEDPTVTGGNGDDYGLAGLFLRLVALPDEAVMRVVTIAIGETLAAGSTAVEALGGELGIAMADWWQADDAFFTLLRDRAVLGRIVADVAGEAVADANVGAKTQTLKRIVADHLDGAQGRDKVERWVPRWMQFPPTAYTERGGVATVAAHARVAAARHMVAEECAAQSEEPGGVPLSQAA
ncbi:UNVERIFIED_ORG: ParB family chromosome partitioning protein [Sphingomonas sp. R1F5B]